MKKVGIMIFIAAIAVGVIAGNLFSFGRMTGSLVKFNIGRGVQGSGVVKTETRDLGDFKGIDVSSVFQVEVAAQKEYGVEVSADDNILPMIKTYVSNGVLKIESDGRFSNASQIKVRVSAPDIESIEASGASRVNAVDIKNASLTVGTSGASKISLAGETSRLDIDVSGASSIDAEGLKARNAKVDASGASSVKVFVLEGLVADASGASRVSYTGGAANIEKRTSGASKISQK